jgi:hypothetical protein
MRVRHKIVSSLLISFLFVSPSLGMEGNMDQDAEEQRVLVAQRFGIEEIRNMSIDQFLIKKREINPQDRGEFFSQEEFEYLVLKEKARAFDQIQELCRDGVLDGEEPENPKQAIEFITRLGVIMSKNEGFIKRQNIEFEKMQRELVVKNTQLKEDEEVFSLIAQNPSPILKVISQQNKQSQSIINQKQQNNIKSLTFAMKNKGLLKNAGGVKKQVEF